MATRFKIIIGIFIIIALGFAAIVLFTLSQNEDSNYYIIAKRWTQHGQFIDYAKDTGVETAEDINYWIDYDKQTVLIGYGYVSLRYTFDQLKTEEEQNRLRYIGITYDIKESGDDFRFYWQGVQLEPWYKDPTV